MPEHLEPPASATDAAADHNQMRHQHEEQEEAVAQLGIQEPEVGDNSNADTEEDARVDDDAEQPSPLSTDPSTTETESPLSSPSSASTDRPAGEDTSIDGDRSTATLEAREDSEISACPLHAHLVAPGQCECVRGYERNELTGTCELLPESAELSHPQQPFALETSA